MLPVTAVGNRPVTTIEGIGATPAGAKVQKAWLDLEVVQCGYCQSGQIMSAAALLTVTRDPDDADIDAAMAGNICRCGTYFNRLNTATTTARELYDAMLELYPDRVNPGSLWSAAITAKKQP